MSRPFPASLDEVAEQLAQRGIKPLSEVKWLYKHSLNARSHVLRLKIGTYHGLIMHRPVYTGRQMASVLFKGNRWESRVPADELFPIKSDSDWEVA